MTYGVRFCGGCNPRYDRGAMLNRLKKYFEGKVVFEVAREDVEYDGLLVLGGCTNCCPSYTQFRTKTDPILVWDNIHYDGVSLLIEKNFEEEKVIEL